MSHGWNSPSTFQHYKYCFRQCNRLGHCSLVHLVSPTRFENNVHMILALFSRAAPTLMDHIAGFAGLIAILCLIFCKTFHTGKASSALDIVGVIGILAFLISVIGFSIQ